MIENVFSFNYTVEFEDDTIDSLQNWTFRFCIILYLVILFSV